jgi:hypothetical protein
VAISRTWGCNGCGLTWKHLHMSRDEAAPPCPRCAQKGRQELSAPALNRGAAPSTGIAIPQNRSKREDLAVKLALEDTGHTDISTQQRAGDIAVKTTDISMGVPKEAPAEIRSGFRALDSDPKARGAQISAMGAGMPVADKRRNLGLLGKMKG